MPEPDHNFVLVGDGSREHTYRMMCTHCRHERSAITGHWFGVPTGCFRPSLGLPANLPMPTSTTTAVPL